MLLLIIVVVIKVYFQAPPADRLLCLPLPGKVQKLFYTQVVDNKCFMNIVLVHNITLCTKKMNTLSTTWV